MLKSPFITCWNRWICKLSFLSVCRTLSVWSGGMPFLNVFSVFTSLLQKCWFLCIFGTLAGFFSFPFCFVLAPPSLFRPCLCQLSTWRRVPPVDLFLLKLTCRTAVKGIIRPVDVWGHACLRGLMGGLVHLMLLWTVCSLHVRKSINSVWGLLLLDLNKVTLWHIITQPVYWQPS